MPYHEKRILRQYIEEKPSLRVEPLGGKAFHVGVDFADDGDLWALRHFARIGTGLAFGNGHATLGIELSPIVGHQPSGIMERHGNRVKNKSAEGIHKVQLHQLAAIHGTVAWQKEIIVRFPHHTQAPLDGIVDIKRGIHPAYNHLWILAQKGVDGCKTHHGLDGLDNKERTRFPSDAMNHGDMVDGQLLYPTRHIGDGVGRVGTAKEQVALLQALPHDRQGKEQSREKNDKSNTT